MSESVFIGIDLGTSAMKGVAVSESGSVVARTRAPYPTHRPAAGVAEQDPADWLDALTSVVSRLLEETGSTSWQAVGLSGMLPTLVHLDSTGAPIGPAITWEDRRAEADGALLESAVGADRLYEATGQRVDGRYLLPMHARAARDDPEGAGRARHLAGAKDYLYARLTGALATDPSTATGFGCYGLDTDSWLEEVLDAGTPGVSVRPALPEPEPSTSSRPLSADASHALGVPSGVPVVLGGADSVLGALGIGARTAGDVAYLAGSSTVVLGISLDARRDPLRRYLVTPLAGVEGYGLEMDLLATGSALDWLAGLLTVAGAAAVLALADEGDAERAPVFLPYLCPGEQGALWDPELAGAVLGLSLSTRPADLARGLLNGIVLESRRCLGVLEESIGAGPVRFSSPGEAASLVRALADASGRSVHASRSPSGDHSALGAAILSARALGKELAVAPESPQERWEPRADRAEAWELLAQRHDRALDAIRRSRVAARREHPR